MLEEVSDIARAGVVDVGVVVGWERRSAVGRRQVVGWQVLYTASATATGVTCDDAVRKVGREVRGFAWGASANARRDFCLFHDEIAQCKQPRSEYLGASVLRYGKETQVT